MIQQLSIREELKLAALQYGDVRNHAAHLLIHPGASFENLEALRAAIEEKAGQRILRVELLEEVLNELKRRRTVTYDRNFTNIRKAG